MKNITGMKFIGRGCIVHANQSIIKTFTEFIIVFQLTFIIPAIPEHDSVCPILVFPDATSNGESRSV